MQGWDANCRWMWICSTVSLPEEGEGFGVSSSPPKPAEVWRTTPPPAPRNIQARPASRQKSCEQAADPRETLPPITPARREARREQGRARPAPSTPKLWHFPPVRAAARFHGDPGAGSGAWDAPERLRLAHAAPTPSLPARLQPTPRFARHRHAGVWCPKEPVSPDPASPFVTRNVTSRYASLAMPLGCGGRSVGKEIGRKREKNAEEHGKSSWKNSGWESHLRPGWERPPGEGPLLAALLLQRVSTAFPGQGMT